MRCCSPWLAPTLLAALALSLTACFSDAPPPAAPTPPATADVTASATANIFSPTTVTIAKGGSVTWTIGARNHNVTFVQAAGVPANVPTTTNSTATRQFAQPGTFAYVCTLHAGMVGTVVVQ
jgi:plastocyanin